MSESLSEPIQTGDVRLLKSQVMLDTFDGGGSMTSVEIVDGQSNNVFPDISQWTRTYGGVSAMKGYLAVMTSNTASYFGSHVIISKTPADPRVSVSIMSTRSWTDRRDAARNRIESYLASGPKWSGHLLETQLEGQRAIQLALRPTDPEPKVGQGLYLVQFEGLPTQYYQYVRVTKTSSVERIFTVRGKDVIRKVCTVELTDPLRFQFEGPTVQDFEEGVLGKGFCRDTRVANAATYYGAQSLTIAGKINDAAITVASIFTQLVPSAQAETPMIDLTAASLSSVLVPGNDGLINSYINAPISASTKLFLGSAIMPSTLVLSAGGNIIKDAAGDLFIGTTIVGSIEYDKGLLTFNANAPSYGGNMPVIFKPAALPLRVQDTAAISIIQDTRGNNYTITLIPVPMPGSLQVSYMSQGKVYYLYDKGDGVLRGADKAFGIGNINYVTGSVILTTGALPDADSEIIFAWGKASTTFMRSGMNIAPARIELQLANPQVTPNSVLISWVVNGSEKVAKDNGMGKLTGDATGDIQYAKGLLSLQPTVLYQPNTEFAIEYQFGQPNEHSVAPNPLPDGNVSIILPSAGGALLPKSIEVEWQPTVNTQENLGHTYSTQTWEPPLPQYNFPVSGFASLAKSSQ